MKKYQELSMKIIGYVGSARSNYIQAIRASRKGEFDKALEYMKQGNKDFQEGHLAHLELLQVEASGEDVTINILLMHAEDQLSAAESFMIIAEEFIETHKKVIG